jgi:teichuronic acid biosynthesis glycosyltransferase TuaG
MRTDPAPDASPAMLDGLISIVTPGYNAARFVGATIESVLSQTYEDWELLVVDDCSRDETAEIVARYAASDPRVRLLRHERNGGPARSRDTAIAAARGRYVAFLDSDDLWLPWKLERQLAYMRQTGAAFTFTAYRRISADGHRTGRLIHVPSRLRYADLLSRTAIATSTVVLDRQLTGPFSMTITYYDDFALWLDILKRGLEAHGLSDDLMRYRVVGKSVSRNKLRSAKWVWRTYRQVEKLSVPYSVWCFLQYALHAAVKYRRF